MQTVQNFLRPHQVAEMSDEKTRLERAVSNPHVQDKGEAMRALRRISRQLETQTPTPYSGDEADKAAKREAYLRDKILEGMPSQEEMRKAPSGAVGKHMAWEKRVKPLMNEWKAIRLRLNAGSNDPDVANFERFRPTASTLNMHNTVVSGTQYFMPETTSPTVMLTDAQIALLRKLAPEVADKLSMMDNATRAEVKAIVTEQHFPNASKIGKEKKVRVYTDEQRKAASERMKATMAARKAKKEASQNEAKE